MYFVPDWRGWGRSNWSPDQFAEKARLLADCNFVLDWNFFLIKLHVCTHTLWLCNDTKCPFVSLMSLMKSQNQRMQFSSICRVRGGGGWTLVFWKLCRAGSHQFSGILIFRLKKTHKYLAKGKTYFWQRAENLYISHLSRPALPKIIEKIHSSCWERIWTKSTTREIG